jgi:hypothetical protein
VVSESVEQAALRRAAEPTDWTARAHREAAAILDETGVTFNAARPVCIVNRDELVSLLSIAWLQGVNLGSHETLVSAETAFERLRDSL